MAYLLVGKRAKEMAAVAEAKGLHFEAEDLEHLADLPLTLLRQADGREPENIMSGRSKGYQVRGFDFPYLAESGADRRAIPPEVPNLAYEDGLQYGCVVVFARHVFPYLHLCGKRGKNYLGNAASYKTGARAFDKSFSIWTESDDFASRLLVPEIQQVLAATRGQFSFEFHQDLVLAFGRSVKPEEFPPLMGMVVTLLEQLPEQVAPAKDPGSGGASRVDPEVAKFRKLQEEEVAAPSGGAFTAAPPVVPAAEQPAPPPPPPPPRPTEHIRDEAPEPAVASPARLEPSPPSVLDARATSLEEELAQIIELQRRELLDDREAALIRGRILDAIT